MTFHVVPDIKHPRVNTAPEKFEQYRQHLKKEGVRVIAPGDLARFVDLLHLFESAGHGDELVPGRCQPP